MSGLTTTPSVAGTLADSLASLSPGDHVTATFKLRREGCGGAYTIIGTAYEISENPGILWIADNQVLRIDGTSVDLIGLTVNSPDRPPRK